MVPPGLYETDNVNDVFVIRFANSEMLDSMQIPTRRSELQELLQNSDAQRIVLDLSRIPYMASVGLGLLVTLHKNMVADGRTLDLCSPQPEIREVLSITKIDTLFAVHDSLDQAVAAS